ncbi:MAG: carboxypeptidase-like regulatory domain-containing protein [Polyangia bacterium]
MRALALLGLALVACGGGAAGTSATNDAGATNSDASASADGFCSTLVTVSASSSVAPAMLVATAHVQTIGTPTWTVSGPSGLLDPTYLDSGHFSVSVDATAPGTYTFFLDLSPGCPGAASTVLMAPNGVVQPYRLRLTPPTTSGLPQQDALVNTFGDTPQLAADVTLQTGSALTGTLRGPGGTPVAIAGQVVLQPQSGPPVLAQVGTSGAFSLPIRLDAMYQLVLLPLDASLAPRLLGPTDGATLQAQVVSTVLDAGATVTGLVRGPSLQPLPNATIALRRGVLQSGVGIAGADGSYALHAAPGTYDLAVSATGWPDLSLSGVDIAIGTTLGVDLTMSRAVVGLTIVAADGSTPVGGAKVTVTSSIIPSAATVHTSSGDRTAIGRLHLEATAAPDGTVALLLPPAEYDVLVDPRNAPGTLTGRHIVVTGAGSRMFALGASVQLSGLVTDDDGHAVGGARVRARASAGAALETSTDATGHYTLSSLPSGVALGLEVVPQVGSLASAQRTLGDATQLGGTLPAMANVTLPLGLTLAGVVRSPLGIPLAGVSIDVLCATCGDATPLYHTDTSGSGGYTLYLPDPGVTHVDGGSDSGTP